MATVTQVTQLMCEPYFFDRKNNNYSPKRYKVENVLLLYA
jgi:hypothetical protein